MPRRLREFCVEQELPVPEGRGALVRAILESIADSYRKALGELERVTGERPRILHIFGGGARNRLLCQLAAHTCRRPVVAGPAEATALGNLLLQARAMGDFPPGLTLRDAAARSSTLERYEPTLQPSDEP